MVIVFPINSSIFENFSFSNHVQKEIASQAFQALAVLQIR